MEQDDNHTGVDAETAGRRTPTEERGADTIDDELVAQTAAMHLGSAASPTPSSPSLTIRIPNPFEAAEDANEDEEMPTASPDQEERLSSQRVAAAPALPQPPRFAGRTMQDRRDFMQKYETYLAAINALQTPYSAAFAMPVGACIESKTKRMIARYEFNSPVNLITELQWIEYFKQARLPSLVDYAAVDNAMKTLKMKTVWPEPESRMMNLQADMETILDKFNLTDQAFEHEQRRLVRYLSDALEPPSFKSAVVTKLTLQQNKRFKHEVVPFCAWVTQLLREFMTWEHFALSTTTAPALKQNNDRGAGGGRGTAGGRGRGGRGRGSGGGRGGRVDGAASTPAATDTEHPPAAAPSDGRRDRNACLKCNSTEHQVRDCPSCTPEEVSQLLLRHAKQLRERREARTTPIRKFGLVEADKTSDEDDRGSVAAAVDGVAVKALMLDTGADASLVARGVLDALTVMGKSMSITPVKGVTLAPVGKKEIAVTRSVTFREVVLTTTAGPLMLRNLSCYVEEQNTSMEMIVGRPIMKLLGYSTDKLLVEARSISPEWELQGHRAGEGELDATPTPLQKMCRLQEGSVDSTLPSEEADEVERHETRTATPSMRPTNLTEVLQYLEKKVEVATKMGLTLDGRAKLVALLHLRVDCFRVEFGNDPPVRVAPLKVRLKEGAKPVKAQPRRYSPTDRAFLDRHTRALLKHGLVYLNHRSRWASAPNIVRKKEQDADPNADPRMTIDSRGVNERTEAMPWPMPVLEVVIGELEGAKYFFVLDWFRGYWQLPLHPDSQEFFSFVTHRGIYTPTRVPMGATDAVAYCQGVVEEIFGGLLGLGILCWLDDILGYAKTEDELLAILEKVLDRCEEFGLKLHAKKCSFFAMEVTWCGRVISAEGVKHCPDRIQGLVDIQPPRTAGELQQFVCAANWMRQSIPEYSRLSAALYEALERAATVAGSRKQKHLSKVRLDEIGWTTKELSSFDAVREALLRMVPLAHPNQTAEVCLYTDASQDFWGAVVTQLPAAEVDLPLLEQNHQPLAFLSGRFVGASSRWSTIEKEAFAIVEAVRRLEYLLLRPAGFRLYTDHRNLVYMFNPYATDGAMARYRADKLQRWALSLMAFKYIIEHVPGEANVWGDLLSRWGAGQTLSSDNVAVRLARLAVVQRVSPLEEEAFVWPSEAEIRAVQEAATAAGLGMAGAMLDADHHLMVTPTGQIYIPDNAVDLQQRLCVVAHAGGSGHRGARSTQQALEGLFFWKTLSTDVGAFVSGCLHCMTTAGGRIPRPFGETLRATKPNELLHFDYLTMVEGDGGLKYVLVLKDGMSGYVELVACVQATADTAYHALIDWFKRFGVVHQWVSDQGAHFRNQIVERLQRALGAHHHFVTAYTPWANGTVEVVNREVLKALKALLSERRLTIRDWPTLLPVVQAALNGMPADRLGGKSPLTAFTALPGGSQLTSILHPRDPADATVGWVAQEIQAHLDHVRQSLDDMHAEMVSSSEKRRRAARERHSRRQGVKLQRFSEGDFVLAATATGRSGNKLALIWRGPKRIVKALNDYTFEIVDIIPPFDVSVRHASRLQLYREAARGRVEELQEQAIYGEGGHLVEALRECRLSPATHRYEILVKWFGLDDVESSWEPAENIRHDVPQLFQAFLQADPHDSIRDDMSRALARLDAPLPTPTRLPRGNTRRRARPRPGH